MNFVKELAFYAAFHQEKRNIWIHVIGVPAITFTLFLVLSRFHLFNIGNFPVSASIAFVTVVSLYYFSLDFIFAFSATLLFGGLVFLAEYVTSTLPATTAWSIFAIGQIVGWGTQFYGHYAFEKRKPAILDNLFQALVSSPLFVVADIYFELGLRTKLKLEIENELKARGTWRDFSKPSQQVS